MHFLIIINMTMNRIWTDGRSFGHWNSCDDIRARQMRMVQVYIMFA